MLVEGQTKSDLDLQRKEVSEIIKRVNQKVKDLKKEMNPSDKESSRNLGSSHNLAAALEEASAEDSAIFNRPPV